MDINYKRNFWPIFQIIFMMVNWIVHCESLTYFQSEDGYKSVGVSASVQIRDAQT